MAKKKTASAGSPDTNSNNGQRTRLPLKRGRVRLREFQRLNDDDEGVRIWMVVGLVNVMKPWLGSTLNGDQIAELINRPNVDVEIHIGKLGADSRNHSMNEPNVQVVEQDRNDGKINVSRLPMANPETRVNGVWKIGRPEEWLDADFESCVCDVDTLNEPNTEGGLAPVEVPIRSVGKNRKTSELYAAVDYRFLCYPGFSVIWPVLEGQPGELIAEPMEDEPGFWCCQVKVGDRVLFSASQQHSESHALKVAWDYARKVGLDVDEPEGLIGDERELRVWE